MKFNSYVVFLIFFGFAGCMLLQDHIPSDKQAEDDKIQKVPVTRFLKRKHRRSHQTKSKKEGRRSLIGKGPAALPAASKLGPMGSMQNTVPEGYPQTYPFLQTSYKIDNPPYAPTILVPYVEDDTVKDTRDVTTMPTEVIVQDKNSFKKIPGFLI